MDADGVIADKGLELRESAVHIEELGEAREQQWRRIDASGAAAAFLGVLGVRGTVASKHQLGMGGEGSGEERIPVLRALGDGFAKQVRLEKPTHDIVKGDNKVVGRDGSVQVFKTVQQFHCGSGGDVLHDDPQAGKAGSETLVDGKKPGFPIEHKTGGLPMHQQWNAHGLHQLQGGFRSRDGVDAAVTIGGDAVRVEFDSEKVGPGSRQLRFGIVLEKKGHQRLKGRGMNACCGEDPFPVSGEHFHGGDRRHQIGHDHGPSQSGGAMRADETQHIAIPEVEMHVERTMKGKGIWTGHSPGYTYSRAALQGQSHRVFPFTPPALPPSMNRSTLLLSAALVTFLPALLHAQPPKPEDKKEEKKDEKKDDKKPEAPPMVETMHDIIVKGQKVTYKSTAGNLTLTKLYGEPRADVFHIAYVRTDGDPAARAKRPVCFCFNGGPGSSSVWLHLGAFGPRRVVLPAEGVTAPAPPYEMTDNQYTLLADCDLVFIDPVSTGLSRPEKGEDARQFHGYREDVESVGDFIRLWVTKNQRWGSAKFLMGESYGGIRGAGLAEHLQSRYGMYLNGLIVVSGLFDFKTLSPEAQNDVPYLTWLPAMNAVAHYHRKLGPELQADFAKTQQRAVEFARGRYALALFKGASLPEDERQAVAGELSALTSLPVDLVLRSGLRIDPSLFRRKILEAEDKVIGRFDGRVIGQEADPSYDVVYGAFATTMNAYLRDASGLNYQIDRPYEILGGPGMTGWNYSNATNEYLEVASTLGKAMNMNASLKVFIACGYHDLATPGEAIDYSVRHMDLTPAQRANFTWQYYDGGHMMYTTLTSLEKLSADVSAFVKGK